MELGTLVGRQLTAEQAAPTHEDQVPAVAEQEQRWQIVDALQTDGRLSFKELGRRINLSAPAVAERVRRLEDSGVITGYRAQVDPRRAGYPFLAFVQMRCALGRCLLKTSTAEDYPEVVEIHKLSGDHCTMLKVRAASLEHFEGLLERLGQHGEMRSSIVLATEYDGRPVEPPVEDYLTATRHSGWTRSPAPATGQGSAPERGR